MEVFFYALFLIALVIGIVCHNNKNKSNNSNNNNNNQEDDLRFPWDKWY